MNAEHAKALRARFPTDMIGKLPRAATKAAAEAGKKGNCAECGKYHILPAIHLDYVSHAAVTDRLLQVDSDWTWEPLGTDERGNPAIVSGLGEPNEPVGLWIKLTVCGVPRPGFGSGKNAKEAISDAIRNAAMRFGVALDLWAKEDLDADNGDKSAGEPDGKHRESAPAPVAAANSGVDVTGAAASPAESLTDKARKAQEARAVRPATKTQIAKIDALIGKAADARKTTEEAARAAIVNDYGPILDLTQDKATELEGKLTRWAAATA